MKIELKPNRVYGLDILRALAILFVVVGHGEYLFPYGQYEYVNYFVFDGVGIFFVLSGFLIGGILIKLLNENTLSSKLIFNFWIKRWFRTIPNYFLILGTILVLNFIFTDNFSIYGKKLFFIFSQNLFWEHPDFFQEAWSLSVEEWFYLLIPIILFIVIKGFKISVNNAFLFTALSIIIGVTLFRYFRYFSYSTYDSSTKDNITTWAETLKGQVFTRLDSLMYGVAGAYIFFHYKTFWNKYKVQFLILGLAIFIAIRIHSLVDSSFGLYDWVFSFSTTSFATLCLIPFLSGIKTGKGIFYKAITYISLLSYSMYLVNLTIVQKWILENIDWKSLENFNGDLFLYSRYFLYWALTIIISILIYKYFEMPIMNLRDKVKIK